MSVGQKLGEISKVKWFKTEFRQKKNLLKNGLLNVYLDKKNLKKFDRFLTSKIDCNSSKDLRRNPLSMLILGQKACFLGPTLFEIPQSN